SKSKYIGDVVSMFDERLYKRWDKLSQALKTNKPIEEKQVADIESLFDKAKSNQEVEQVQKFTHAMYGISIGPAMALAKNVDFSNHKKMMDIGGGSGVYAIQVVANSPNNMSAVVLDSKPVCQVADRYIQQYDLQDKVQTVTFDFFKDRLPENGTIIISEWLLNDEKTGPIPSALMGLTMIVENSGGRGYSYNEILQMLTEVGFKNIERRPLIEPAEIVIGYKK
ncbi:MAG: hypothetical protein FIO04_02290, partial [Nitrosopumilales archaeon]|nr:hypothetical protein [Nitrosopumilales archaeon]